MSRGYAFYTYVNYFSWHSWRTRLPNGWFTWFQSQIEVPRDIRNSKSQIMTSSGENGLNVRTQVPNGIGQGVRRSKRPLLTSRTRCNVLWKPPKFGNKVKIGNKVQAGNKFANRCNVWSIEDVTVYGYVPECHATFGRGRLLPLSCLCHSNSAGVLSYSTCLLTGHREEWNHS